MTEMVAGDDVATDPGEATGAGPDGGAPTGDDGRDPTDGGTDGPATDDGTPGPGGGPGSRRRAVATVAGLTGIVAVPLVASLVALRHPVWYPLVDVAQIEMRIRDVGTSHPPLIGVPGRFEGYGRDGFHPGPAFFYALSPVYRLLGSSSWALRASSAALTLLAVGAGVWLGQRRAGRLGAVVAASALALVAWSYGLSLLTDPWNPFVAMMWWPVLLLAVWSVFERDLALLPVVVVVGSFCAQTHVGYVGLAGGLLVATIVAVVVIAVRHRDQRGRALRWSAAALVAGAVVWLPPIVEERQPERMGNLSVLLESLRNPVDDPPAFGEAVELWVQYHDPSLLAGADRRTGRGTLGGGGALLVAWVAAAVVTARRHRYLRPLLGVSGLGLALGFASLARLTGVPWFYLTLWSRGTTVLALVAIGATVAAEVARRRAGHPAPGWLRPAALAVAALPVVGLVADAPGTEPPDAALSSVVGDLVTPTAAALAAGDVPGEPGEPGAEPVYLVTWHDPVSLGAPGYGLFLELERRGFSVRGPANQGLTRAMGGHRTIEPSTATAEVHVAVGDLDIDRWYEHAGARLLALVDHRTADERALSRELSAEVHDRLVADGLDDLADTFEGARINVLTDPDMPEDLLPTVGRINRIGEPYAVFVAPPPEP